MQCCVPYCNNSSDNVSPSERKRISFHSLPSDVCLRAAWLRALGKQDNHLEDPAVVCSEHFLAEEIYETESGLKQIVTGAIPSTVQVCMICLDTDSKMFLMSKHKLQEAYEKLTGQPLYDQGNLKQTVCVQCAQRLINFSRFRDKSLRARALMMDLVEKLELITRQDIKMINRTKNHLKSNFVVTMLGPDPCDLYILENSSEDKQTKSGTFEVKVKKEESFDSMWIDEDMGVSNDDDKKAVNVKHEFVASNQEHFTGAHIKMEPGLLYNALCKAPERNRTVPGQVVATEVPLKCERDPFQYTVCFEELICEHESMRNFQNSDGDRGMSQVCKPHTAVSSSSSHSSLLTENKQPNQKLNDGPLRSTDSVLTSVDPLSGEHTTNSENKVQAEDAVTVQKNERVVKIKKCHSFTDLSAGLASNNENKVQAEDADTVHKSQQVFNIDNRGLSNQSSDTNSIPNFNDSLLRPQRTRTSKTKKQYSCELCDYKSFRKANLVRHVRTHTGENPFSCDVCEYKTAHKPHLIRHKRTHTGEKPYSCELCKYKTAQKTNLINHIRTHTGDKVFSCDECEYKTAHKPHLVRHKRTHTGEKPYSCELCKYKFARNGDLVRHMRTHTGEKPFSCELCEYKTAQKSHLGTHMRTQH
ncbi:zinc finger protein Xfin-like [Maniola jurtina]|uniref:zinc finger protein Xfin-like n=1 Tax=Maniola jurtina TaxID=191418 RepID=UPI001E68DEF7|nr:zinc finger protein Xfin-like [Maniola jurtina]